MSPRDKDRGRDARDSPAAAADDATVTRWDRPRWISVFSSHNPTIREVTECLGLGLSVSSSTTNRGIPKFDNPDYRKLSSEVTRLSKELPKERDALLDFAADAHSLDAELEELLATYGPAIWGRHTDRACLLTPDPAKKTYPKDLFYDDADDKAILKIHLHRWIIIKACYYIRNMKLKRPSAATDYDTLADLEADGDPLSPARPQLVVKLPLSISKLRSILSPSQSPKDTPNSISPPVDASSTTAGAEPSARLFGGKKRKSSVFASLSDGDDVASTPAKRPYQSHTMPLSRKSPRKSLQSMTLDSPVSENIPPVPLLGQSQTHSLQSTPGATSASEATRPLLTPLTSNDLNGTARPASAASPPGSFTAVNLGGNSTAVNSTPSVRDAAPQNPPQSNGRGYSSPYDTTPFGAPATQNGHNPPKAPPLNTASAIAPGFQAINSPTVTNGVSARNSPVAQHNPHAHTSSQHQTSVPPQPASRSNTPVTYNNHRPSLGYKRSSRSNTPIAPATTAHFAAPVLNTQSAPSHAQAPAVQPIVPSPHYIHVQPAGGRIQHATVPSTSSVPNPGSHAPQSQPILKSHPLEPPSVPFQTAPTIDLSLLQCEVLGSLMQYLFPKPSSPPDEGALLHRMESLWHHGSPIFRKQIGPLYELQSKVLLSWITERRKLAQLRHALTYAPGVPAAEMVERLLAMNDLRIMRLKWKNMSSADGLSAEDLLCTTFATITNTEGTEDLFKVGLDKLNNVVFEFLRNEDMRILMQKR